MLTPPCSQAKKVLSSIGGMGVPGSKPHTLPASLKDDTARMNDSNKHKVTGQMNRQTADPRANASVFLFFPTAHFLKTILASRTNGTFGFARHTSRPFAKPKEPFFANPHNSCNS